MKKEKYGRNRKILLWGLIGYLFLCPVFYSPLEVRATEDNPSGKIRVEQQGEATGKYVYLKKGNYERWIDRISLSEELADFDMMEFYNKLVEGTDGDGEKDIFIDDDYFDGEHAIEAVVIRKPYVQGMSLDGVLKSEYEKYQPAIMAVYCAFDRDHPEVFWLSGNWQSMITAEVKEDIYELTISFLLQDNVQEENFNIRLPDFNSEKKIRDTIAVREEAIEKILRQAEGKSDYEKVVLFYSYLIKKNAYYTGDDEGFWEGSNSSCISALTGSVGEQGPVCEGYARAFKVLCDRAGIPCVLTDGLAKGFAASGREEHMWNYVNLYGSWYGVDATFGDPVSERIRGISGFENSDYLLVGSETVIDGLKFRKSHPEGNTVSEDVISFTNGPVLSKFAYPVKKFEKTKILGNSPVNAYPV